MLSLAKYQFAWFNSAAFLTNNFFQSMGNVSFPLNLSLIPGYAVSCLQSGCPIDPVLSYTVFGLELFATALILARSVGARLAEALIAAWLLPLLALPIHGMPAIYPVTVLSPQWGTAISVATVFIVLFGKIGLGSRSASLVSFFALAACVFYISLSQPTTLVLIAPVLIVFSLAGVARCRSSRERTHKLCVGAALAGLLAASGAMHYVWGLVSYSAPAFFPTDLMSNRMTSDFISIAFHVDFNPYFFAFGAAGALYAAISREGALQSIALGTVACVVAILGFGGLTLLTDFWRGPSPLYFEFFLWPFYAVYGARLIVSLATGLTRLASYPLGFTCIPGEYALSMPIAALPWALAAVLAQENAVAASPYPHPPALTPIVEMLKQETSLAPGAEFRGRVATFTGLGFERSISWFDLAMHDYEFIKRLGNDHRMMGLWHYDIPTLFEYSSLLTPQHFYFTRHFFALPRDQQMRSVMALRHADSKMLSLIGVRFVVSDAPLKNMSERKVVPLGALGNLYLYELENANRGQYSPIRTVVSSSAEETVFILGAPGFDPLSEAVVTTAPIGSLRAARSARITVGRDGVHVEATSDGRSLIVLPLEFSHCLTLTQASAGSTPIELIRANLIQAAVLFDKSINARIQYATGPLRNATCRIADAKEFRSLLAGSPLLGRK